MTTKGRSRIAFRIFLVMLLIAAALNTMYVYQFNRPTQPMHVEPSLETLQQRQQSLITTSPRLSGPRISTTRPRYPTDTWHGNVEVQPLPDGSYTFIAKIGNQQEPIALTSFEAWISKVGSTEETKVGLRKDSKGLTATVRFPERGDWMMRVRVTSGNNSLEFSQRVQVK